MDEELAECSGALDWGSKGCLFETRCRRSHCSKSNRLYPLLSTGSTHAGGQEIVPT